MVIVTLQINGSVSAEFKFPDMDDAWNFANAMIEHYQTPTGNEPPPTLRPKISSSKRRISFTEPDKQRPAILQAEQVHPARLNRYRTRRDEDWMTRLAEVYRGQQLLAA